MHCARTFYRFYPCDCIHSWYCPHSVAFNCLQGIIPKDIVPIKISPFSAGFPSGSFRLRVAHPHPLDSSSSSLEGIACGGSSSSRRRQSQRSHISSSSPQEVRESRSFVVLNFNSLCTSAPSAGSSCHQANSGRHLPGSGNSPQILESCHSASPRTAVIRTAAEHSSSSQGQGRSFQGVSVGSSPCLVSKWR